MIALPDGYTSILVDTERCLVQGHQQVLVASKSHAGQWHTVSFEFNEQNGKEEWVCTCRGFEIRHSCRHVKAVDRWNAGLADVKFVNDPRDTLGLA